MIDPGAGNMYEYRDWGNRKKSLATASLELDRWIENTRVFTLSLRMESFRATPFHIEGSPFSCEFLTAWVAQTRTRGQKQVQESVCWRSTT